MSEMVEHAPQRPPPRELALVGTVAAFAAACLLFPMIGEPGLWSAGDLEVLDRTRAALGEPLSDMVRSPALPDAFRTLAYGVSPSDAALRMPGALAALLLAVIAATSIRAAGRPRLEAALAFGCLASTPAWIGGAMTLLGPGVGEAAVALGIGSGIAALHAKSWPARAALGFVAALAIGTATACVGLLLGAALPLIVLTSVEIAIDVKVRAGLVCVAAAIIGLTAWLAWHQGEGFIPLLGASKDLEILAEPNSRGLADALEEVAYQLFLWTPAALAGALVGGRPRWVVVWFALGIVLSAVWSSVYGPTAAPVLVPAAWLSARALITLADKSSPAPLRRFVAIALLLGVAILGKDAERAPSRIVSPYLDLGLERRFPATAIGTDDIFGPLTLLALGALLVAFIVSPPSEGAGSEASALRLPASVFPTRWRVRVAHATLVAAAFLSAATIRFVLTPASHAQLSAKAPFATHKRWVEEGLVSSSLAFHRIRDPGVERYAPPRAERVYYGSRHQLTEKLHSDTPTIALIRASDFANFFQRARTQARPFFGLNADHADLVLVANYLPDGLEEVSPLSDIVLDEVPDLEHQTLLRFEDLVEVVAWEIDGEIKRGNTVTIHLALRPLKRMPAGTKIYARLLQGRISRVNGLPHDVAEGKYPANLWREGDIIHHRYEFEIPRSSTLPGAHDVVIGIRRSERKNLAITLPEQEHGAFGVRIRGMKKREFAVIGTVDIK